MAEGPGLGLGDLVPQGFYEIALCIFNHHIQVWDQLTPVSMRLLLHILSYRTYVQLDHR